MTGSTLIVNKDNTTTDQLRRWAILIDTGAMTSVAAQEHFQSHTNQTTTSTRPTNTHSSERRRKHTHLRHQRSNTSTRQSCNTRLGYYQLRSLSATSTCAIFGLDTITKKKLHLKVEGYRGHLARGQAGTQLDYIGHHFYMKATVFSGLYDVDYTPDFANWYHGWYDENDSNNKIYGLLQDNAEQIDCPQQEAQVPKTYKRPILPTAQQIEEHNLTHLPYRDWCKHC
eukprot:4811235-Amphidinium_carterae.2